MNPRIARALGGVSAAGLVVVLMVACSSHHTPSAQGTQSPSGDATSSSAAGGAGGSVSTAPTTGTDPSSPDPTGVPASRTCGARDLRLAQLPGGDAAGGTVVVAIALTNTSSSACSMKGYPAFLLAGSAGSQPVTIQHGGDGIPTLSASPAPVTLAPKGQGGFLVVYLNRPQNASGSCGYATKMTLSIGTATVAGPVQISVCGSPLKVSPYVPRSKLATA